MTLSSNPILDKLLAEWADMMDEYDAFVQDHPHMVAVPTDSNEVKQQIKTGNTANNREAGVYFEKVEKIEAGLRAVIAALRAQEE